MKTTKKIDGESQLSLKPPRRTANPKGDKFWIISQLYNPKHFLNKGFIWTILTESSSM